MGLTANGCCESIPDNLQPPPDQHQLPPHTHALPTVLAASV